MNLFFTFKSAYKKWFVLYIFIIFKGLKLIILFLDLFLDLNYNL